MTSTIEQEKLITELVKELNHEGIQKWVTDLNRNRDDNGRVIPRTQEVTSMKIYLTPDCKDIITKFCAINGISTAHLIRQLVARHFIDLLHDYTMDL